MEKGIRIDFRSPQVTTKRDRAREGEEESEDSSDEDGKDAEKKRLASIPKTRNAQKFDAKDPDAGQLFVYVGKSERGKTHFMKWLLYAQMLRKENPIKTGIVFVKTKYKHSFDFVPEERVFEGYNEEILKTYVGNLKKMFEVQKYLEPSFLVFDDLLGILNNRSQWFSNFIATYRHLNIHIHIAVQYLTGLHAINPIMREQTTFAFMFNSKAAITIKNLYLAYGQLFEKEKEFKQYLFDHTEPRSVGPYVCVVYEEFEDDIDKNYIPMRAPAKLPKGLQLVY